MPISVLHIGLEKQWRGGENQILLLIKNSDQNEFKHHVAYPSSSSALEIFAKDVPVCSLPSRSGSDLRSVFKITQYCSANDIQILHAHSSAAMSLALLCKRLMPKIKMIAHRRVDFPIKQGYFTKRKYMSKKIDHYIAISDCTRNRLIEYGIPASKVTIARSSIDSSRYEKIDSVSERSKLITKSRLAPDTPLIGMAAAMTGEKGHQVLLRACELLVKDQYSYHCYIAGAGEKEEEIKELCKSLGLTKKVTFLGFVPEVAPLLSAIDILVVPSESEGLGTVVMEGIAGGCSVVATRVGGIPEMIRHDETGLLFPVGDANELATQLKRLIDDSDLRQKLGVNARNYMRENFSLASMVKATTDIYRKVCGD